MKSKLAAALVAVVMIGAARASDLSWPVGGRVTSVYWSARPDGYHRAIDIAGPTGTAVGAARAGRVFWRGKDKYGALCVSIDHGHGYRTVYAHFSRWGAFHEGDTVARGATIGYRGSTGFSTGPHLHFHLLHWGARIYIPGRIGQTPVKGASIPYDYPGL